MDRESAVTISDISDLRALRLYHFSPKNERSELGWCEIFDAMFTRRNPSFGDGFLLWYMSNGAANVRIVASPSNKEAIESLTAVLQRSGDRKLQAFIQVVEFAFGEQPGVRKTAWLVSFISGARYSAEEAKAQVVFLGQAIGLSPETKLSSARDGFNPTPPGDISVLADVPLPELDNPLTVIQDLIQDIKEGKTAIFCGAGISFHSGLPLAAGLVRYLLESLSVEKGHIDLFLSLPLPFEAFMETIRDASDLSRILEIFRLGVPCHAHLLIGRLAKAGQLRTICTTNFDLLIERAFERAGLTEDLDYYSLQSMDDFDRLSVDDGLIKLIKIHGSIDKPEAMAITLQQVSSPITSAKRQKAIDYLFSTGPHKNVVILGYSCSDIFDISPQIQSIVGIRKPVLIVDHSTTETRLEDIRARQFKNPFRDFTGGRRLRYDTDKLLTTLWGACQPEPLGDGSFVPFGDGSSVPFGDGSSVPPESIWKENVNLWAAETSLFDRLFIAGQLFSQVAQYDLAVYYLSKALSLSSGTQHRLKVALLSNLATCLVTLDKYAEAKKYAEEAVLLANKGQHDSDRAMSFLAMGRCLLASGDYHGARGYLATACDLARAVLQPGFEFMTLTHLGIVHMALSEYLDAVGVVERSITIARALGQKSHELGAIAVLAGAYSAMGSTEKALAKHAESLALARDIGDRIVEATTYVNLGLLHHSRGDGQRALEAIERGQRIAREIGNRKLQRNAAEHRGHICLSRGDAKGAEEHYRLALAISRELGHVEDEGRALGNLGRVFYAYGNLRLAKQHFQQALGSSVKAGDKQGRGNWTGNLGVALVGEGQYSDGESKLIEALEIAVEISDKESEALWSGHLGWLAHITRKQAISLKFYGRAVRLAKECGNIRMESELLEKRGDVHREMGNEGNAVEDFALAAACLTTILGADHPRVCRLLARSKRSAWQ